MIPIAGLLSFDAARMLVARWKREISLEYLTEEKFVPLSTTDEYRTSAKAHGIITRGDDCYRR